MGMRLTVQPAAVKNNTDEDTYNALEKMREYLYKATGVTEVPKATQPLSIGSNPDYTIYNQSLTTIEF